MSEIVISLYLLLYIFLKTIDPARHWFAIYCHPVQLSVLFAFQATPHCLETSCLDDDLKRDVCARLESPATPVQEMEWIVDDDDESATAVEFGLQMWRRGECSLTASQLHCLNVQQLLALRNELQTLVGRKLTLSNVALTFIRPRHDKYFFQDFFCMKMLLTWTRNRDSKFAVNLRSGCH